MKCIPTAIRDLLIIEPKVFNDSRGFFFESFNKGKFADIVGRDIDFVKDSHSFSTKHVLRGLHYQIQHPQAKLVRVIQGSVLDVTVDIRKNSQTFGQHVALELSAESKRMLWIPEGFAHGFVVLSDAAELLYKASDYWFPEHERCIRWDDPALAIDWKLLAVPVVAVKDAKGLSFAEAELFV